MRRVVLGALAGVLTALGALAPAAAARAAQVNATSVRSQIANLVKQSYPDLPTGNVMCPPGVPLAAGNSFACTVQLPGTFLVIGAEQLDGSGRVKLTAQQAVIPRAQVEQFVASNATVSATASCGSAPLLVLRPGQTISCTAAIADGSNRRVQVLVRDTDGNVAIVGVT